MNIEEARAQLHSKFPDLRREAVLALAGSSAPDRADLLLERLRRESERPVLAVLLEGLAGADDPAVVLELVRILADPPYPGAAGEAGRALRHFRAYLTPGQLVPYLASTDALTRMATAELLGILGDPAAVPALEDALADENVNVTAAAARALWQVAPQQAPARLVAVWRNLEPFRQATLAYFFSEHPEAAATVIPELIALAGQPAALPAQLPVIKTLGATGDARAISFLRSQLSHDRLWPEAARALGQFEDPAAAEALWAALDQAEKPDQQLVLLQALANHYLPEIIPWLTELLEAPALSEMAQMDARRLAKTVAELLVEAGEDEVVARIWQRAEPWFGIPRIHSSEWLPLYLDLLRDPEHPIRKPSAELEVKNLRENLVQMHLDGETVVPRLLELLQGDDTFAATVAAETLGSIGSPEAIPQLAGALRSGRTFAARPLVQSFGDGAESDSLIATELISRLLTDERVPPVARLALRDACLRYPVRAAVRELIRATPGLMPQQRQVVMEEDWRRVEVDEALAARIFEERAHIFHEILAFAGAFEPPLTLEQFLTLVRDAIGFFSRHFLLSRRSDKAYHDLNAIFLDELPPALFARVHDYLPATHEEVFALLQRYLLGFYRTLVATQVFTGSLSEAEFLVLVEPALVERTSRLFQQEPPLVKLETTLLGLPGDLFYQLKKHVNFFSFDYEFGYQAFFEGLAQALDSTPFTLTWSYNEAKQALHFAIDDASWTLANVPRATAELDIPFYELLEDAKRYLTLEGWHWFAMTTGDQTASVLILPLQPAMALRQYLPDYDDRRTQLLYRYRHDPHALP